MKNFAWFLTSILLVPVFVFGQQGSWVWLNPYPTGLQINQVYFLSESEGFVVGRGGTLMRTSDGGDSWLQATVPVDVYFIKMVFSGASNGWVLGKGDYYYGGRVFATTDGGMNWVEQTLPTTYGNVQDIFFLDNQNGWIVGENGLVFRTSNGGSTWQDKSITGGDVPSFYFVSFSSLTQGIALGRSSYYYGFAIAQTTDGGDNWLVQYSGLQNSMYGADRIDNSTVVTVGDQGLVLKTSDEGKSWFFPMGLPSENLAAVDFYDPLWGMAAGESGSIIQTDDGGSTWTEILTGYSIPLRSIQILNQNAIYAGGSGEYYSMGPGILVSTDGGNIWSNKARSIEQSFSIQGISFSISTYGMVAGDYYVYGTADGGINWNLLRFNNNDYIQDVVCIDSLNAIAVGGRSGQALALRTTNGGTSWQTLVFGSYSTLNRVCFPDESTGYSIGYNGTMLKTTNQGQSWTPVNTGTTNYFTDLEFKTSETGWICGGDNKIRKTTDGGATWNVYQVSSSQYDETRFISFPNANTGYAVVSYGSIYKSTNGGVSWSPLGGYFYGAEDIVFLNSTHGWVASYDGIMATTDGGSTWQTQFSSSYSGSLQRFSLLPDSGLWAGGDNTCILKYTGEVIVGITEEQPDMLPEEFSLSQNYPNPFNPVTNIRFGLPGPTHVSIEIFNLLGQRVMTLLDENRPAGYHVITFDTNRQGGIASGMYFYRIQAGKFTDTKRMLLIK